MGKSSDSVQPAIQTLPAGSSATRPPASHRLPPSVVEKRSAEPVLLNFARYPSGYVAKFVRGLPPTRGNSHESVVPTTYAFPDASTATPAAKSQVDPPRYVE